MIKTDSDCDKSLTIITGAVTLFGLKLEKFAEDICILRGGVIFGCLSTSRCVCDPFPPYVIKKTA